MLLLQYFYKEIIIATILTIILFRFFYLNVKKKDKISVDVKQEKDIIKSVETISKEKLLGIVLIIGSIIILGIVMYYLIPFLLDYILPKDN